MSRLYLITGFLGAGKTTFLKNFIRLFSGQKIQLIVNEFGAEGVDGILLSNLGAYWNEIEGGSIFCSCRMDQFEKVLRQSADVQADVILVEASGLSDPTGVHKLFSHTDCFPNIEYRGGICLIDAIRFPKLYATARVCKKQLAASDVAVINKCDCAKPTQLDDTRALIMGQRPDIPLVETSFGRIDSVILEYLQGLCKEDGMTELQTADLTLRSMLVMVAPTISRYELTKFVEMFLEETYRVKGFIRTTDGLMLADCVGNIANITPYAGEVEESRVGHLVVLSGNNMSVRKAVSEAAKWYEKHIVSID